MDRSEYLRFVQVDAPERKTQVWEVRSKRSHDLLGTVQWYGAWRQYCFYPAPNTIFNAGCLADIREFTGMLMDERRDAQRRG